MMMFGSQLVLFMVPRLLKKFSRKEDDIASSSRVQELDERGNPIPTETTRKIDQVFLEFPAAPASRELSVETVVLTSCRFILSCKTA
jgi:hypothetical protein